MNSVTERLAKKYRNLGWETGWSNHTIRVIDVIECITEKYGEDALRYSKERLDGLMRSALDILEMFDWKAVIMMGLKMYDQRMQKEGQRKYFDTIKKRRSKR